MSKKKKIKITQEDATVEEKEQSTAADVVEEAGQETDETSNDTNVEDKVELSSLTDKIEALQQEKDALRDKMLRAAAEFENYKKRRSAELERITSTASRDLIEDLLPAIDDLDLLLANNNDSTELEPFLKGAVMIRQKLLDALKRRGVEIMDPTGEPFNPELHEALMEQPSPDAEPGTVLMIHQKGYTIKGALLRPARVIVAAEA